MAKTKEPETEAGAPAYPELPKTVAEAIANPPPNPDPALARLGPDVIDGPLPKAALTDLDDDQTALLEKFAADFIDDLPAEAKAGHYGATSRDRWANLQVGLPDGDYDSNGWRFSFLFGVFTGACVIADEAVGEAVEA